MGNNKYQEMLEQAENFDVTKVIEMFSLKTGIDLNESSIIMTELKKWMILSSIDEDERYTMLGVVDKMWHTFILFTREYDDFCDKVFGKFIHHVPDLEHFKKLTISRQKENISIGSKLADIQLSQSVVEGYRKLLVRFQDEFGEVNTHIWPDITPDGEIFCDGGCCSATCACGGRVCHND